MNHKVIVELSEMQEECLRKIANAHFAGNMCAAATSLVDRGLCRILVNEPAPWQKAKVYISGMISDDPDYKEKFHAAHQMLEDCGFDVLDPTELVKVSPEKDYTDYLSEAVWHMLKADELYMLKGWSTSTGAKLELKLARLLNKRVQFQ